MLNKIKNSILLMTTLLGTSLFANSRIGDGGSGVSGQLKNIGGEATVLGSFLLIIIAVLGVIVLLNGALGLKKYADDSRSNPLMKPLLYFAVGAILTGFSAFQGMLGKSATGKIDTSQNVEFKASEGK